MSSLYDTYATQTGSDLLDHSADVHRVAEHFRRRLLPALPPGVDLQRSRIFEFGAGWGRNLLALSQLGATELYGIDISEEQVAIGRRLGLANLELVIPGSALPATMRQSTFDIVLAIDVLEHLDLDGLHQFSRMVRDILRPGGLLIVQVPNAQAPFNPVTAGDLTHLRGFTPSSLRQLFALAGTDAVHVAGMPFPGHGASHRMRAAVAQGLVAPCARLLSWVLYGRSPDRVWVEPNLLGVACSRQTPRP
jgi:2-polyprenyl-3-methyl-5-hydroxy-6-metoxy-1,4-benzoquinol methylase